MVFRHTALAVALLLGGCLSNCGSAGFASHQPPATAGTDSDVFWVTGTTPSDTGDTATLSDTGDTAAPGWVSPFPEAVFFFSLGCGTEVGPFTIHLDADSNYVWDADELGIAAYPPVADGLGDTFDATVLGLALFDAHPDLLMVSGPDGGGAGAFDSDIVNLLGLSADDFVIRVGRAEGMCGFALLER